MNLSRFTLRAAFASSSVFAAEAPRPLNFANDIVPILTKGGCNSGGCHGKSGGQNGFKLSLLGFEPSEDLLHAGGVAIEELEGEVGEKEAFVVIRRAVGQDNASGDSHELLAPGRVDFPEAEMGKIVAWLG